MSAHDSTLMDKALGCLLGGLIGDAMGTPTDAAAQALALAEPLPTR